MTLTIHKEGYTIILITFVALAAINLLSYYFINAGKIFQFFLFAISMIFLLLVINFFRNPVRQPSMGENNILAPADGKVVVIEEVEEPEYFKDKRKQVSIFMSPLNVHVNWYPISGTVKYFRYHAGEYLVAWHPKSSVKNERTTTVIENDKGIILTRQIAGAVARRIIYYCHEGDSVKQGEQLGFIKFGSRLDIFLPLHAKVNVEIGQKVTGCETVVAFF